MDNLSPAGDRIFIATVVGCAISTVAVLLRFYCKYAIKAGFQMDDAWMIFSMLAYYSAAGVTIWGLEKGGGGLPTETLIVEGKFDIIRIYLYSLFVGLNLYLCVVYGLKMALLTFYQRIFATLPYRRASLVVMAVSTAWVVGAIFGVLFNCKPANHFWNRLKPGTCMNFNTYAVATGVVEILIDVTILALPTRTVFTLQMPLRTKIVLASIFMLGGFAIITSIIRLANLYQKSSIFVDFSDGQFWSAVHLATGVVCASAPIYKPLWAPLAHTLAEIRKRYNFSLRSLLGRRSGRRSKPNSSNPVSLEYVSLGDGYKTSSTLNTTAEAHKDGGNIYTVEGAQPQEVHATGILRSQQFENISAPLR